MKKEKTISKQWDRIAGALYGVAVGDALGGPLEFMSPEAIHDRHGFVVDMIGGGWLSLRPGEITDDTQMTLCVAEGIAESPDDPVRAVGRRFIQWADSGPKDIGGACASSIHNAIEAGGKAPSPAEWQAAAERTQRMALQPVEGNGALMRTVYPGLFYQSHHRAEIVAMKIARMTHAGPRSTEACILYSRMVNLLTASESDAQDTRSVREFLLEHCQAVAEYGRAVMQLPDPAAGGYVVDSMRIAVGCLAASESFEEAVSAAANMGGDAVTNAAITGGLAGAWYGFSAIPARWINALAPDVRVQIGRLVDAALKARED